MDTFYGGQFEHALGGTFATLGAFPRVNLPDCAGGVGTPDHSVQNSPESDEARAPQDAPHEIPAIHGLVTFQGKLHPADWPQLPQAPLPAHERRRNNHARPTVPVRKMVRMKVRLPRLAI